MQEGNRHLVPGQDHPLGSLLGYQFLQCSSGFSCKGHTLVFYVTLVGLLLEPTRVALAMAKRVVVWPGHLFQEAAARHEQARRIRIHQHVGVYTGTIHMWLKVGKLTGYQLAKGMPWTV
jgi:hypothetical protein